MNSSQLIGEIRLPTTFANEGISPLYFLEIRNYNMK